MAWEHGKVNQMALDKSKYVGQHVTVERQSDVDLEGVCIDVRRAPGCLWNRKTGRMQGTVQMRIKPDKGKPFWTDPFVEESVPERDAEITT
jgi:hypothetical protein